MANRNNKIKTYSPSQKRRREAALQRLQNQKERGTKPLPIYIQKTLNNGSATIPLTKKDMKRINQQIETITANLKSKTK